MQNAWLPLQQLNRPPIRVGGLCYFYFTPVEDVLLWPKINPATGTITEELVLKEGKTWHKCDVINPKKAYSEELKTTDAGTLVDCRISGILPDDLPSIAYTINQLKYSKYALVLKERNGMMRLVGNEFYGADFSFSYNSSDDGRERNLSFTWQSEDAAPLYLSDISVDGSVIIPPWKNGGGGTDSGFVTKSINATGIEGQSDYTFNELVGKDIFVVSVPPVVMYDSPLQDQYTYTKSSGTIHFNYPLKGEQKIIILYNDEV